MLVLANSPVREAEGYRRCMEAQKAMFAEQMRVRKVLDENWMRVAPGTDAAIWRPWSRETGEL